MEVNMAIYNFLKNIVGLTFKTIYKTKVEGKENLPVEQGYMICSNHIHIFDPIFISTFSKHKISYMAKKELFKFPPIGFFFKKIGAA